MPANKDTIAAIATPPGRSGIGVIRISGKLSRKIYQGLTGRQPKDRYAHHVSFKSSSNQTIDKGVSLYFKGPASYTGEDVMECYAHGNRIILGMLLDEIISLGARAALPGEFTERSFLNDKIDLVQAEAVADLIDSNSKKAARSAMRSLDGVFSDSVLDLKEKIINVKALLEATLDFPDEEDIGINTSPAIENIKECLGLLDGLLTRAKKGRLLDHTPLIVIAGPPNVGKSTLINFLSGFDSAIVSDTPGTTRDIIKEKILLRDQLVTLVDTAGIHKTSDSIEKEGIEKAYKVIKSADLVLYLIDYSTKKSDAEETLKEYFPLDVKYIFVTNKIDLCKKQVQKNNINENSISAKTGEGIEELVEKIGLILDFSIEDEDVVFARQRHIDALNTIRVFLNEAAFSMEKKEGLEIVAELLRQSLSVFDEIVGKITTDDILDNIFSRFCIGK
jgi:tRNA modification GTPase